MTPEITRVFGIDLGHRLMGHEGKCRNVHGHRYTIELSCAGLVRLDQVGRVIDFSVMKSSFGKWLDEVFDHGFVAQEGDPIIGFLRSEGPRGLKTVVIDVPPTVENLARIWFEHAAHLLAEFGIMATKVKAYETPNCWAEYTVLNAKEDKAREDAHRMIDKLADESRVEEAAARIAQLATGE